MQQNIETFKIKQFDTLPCLKVAVKTRTHLGSKIPFNLSGVTACTFSMSDDCGNLIVSSMPAQITCVSGGTIQYNWIVGDTDNDGFFDGEFEMTFGGGGKMTVPTAGYIKVEIFKDINGF
jgi:hypothetical protein